MAATAWVGCSERITPGRLRKISGRALYKTFEISPITSRELGFAKARIETRSGVIVSEWTIGENGTRYFFTVPEGTTAEVTIDGKTKTYTAGSYTVWGK